MKQKLGCYLYDYRGYRVHKMMQASPEGTEDAPPPFSLEIIEKLLFKFVQKAGRKSTLKLVI